MNGLYSEKLGFINIFVVIFYKGNFLTKFYIETFEFKFKLWNIKYRNL